jgi:hypothetical protein
MSVHSIRAFCGSERTSFPAQIQQQRRHETIELRRGLAALGLRLVGLGACKASLQEIIHQEDVADEGWGVDGDEVAVRIGNDDEPIDLADEGW